MASRQEKEPLWDACEAGNADRIRELFQISTLQPKDAQDCLNQYIQDRIGVDVIRSLLENGASLNQLDVDDLREIRSIEVFRFLAENGLDFKKEGYKILEDFVEDREIIDFLLDHGVDINRPDEDRSSNGHEFPVAARRNTGSKVLQGPRPKDLYDKTLGVLNNAAALGDIDLFDHLVSRGADPTKSIALHTVARCPDPTKTKAMISHLISNYDFDPNASDNSTGLRNLGCFGLAADDGGRPLTFAKRYENNAAVEALQEYGADPSLGAY